MSFLERFLLDFGFDTLGFVFDILIPTFLAILFGGLIGFQREKHERPAGLRTHALVCLGATVFTIVSHLGFPGSAGFDTSRIAAGVVTGIGFIGAGAIFRQGSLVKGVTTAASIWISASIGLALGAGSYYLATVVTIFGLIILSILKNLENRVIHVPYYTAKITVHADLGKMDEIRSALEGLSCEIKTRKYDLVPERDEKTYTFQLRSRVPDFPDKLIERISNKKGVVKVSVN